VHTQVTPVLRWLRHRLDLRVLAQQAGVSIATAYRYLHESLDAIAAHPPTLDQVLTAARAAGTTYPSVEAIVSWSSAHSVKNVHTGATY
jgi:hypothetical protein